MPQAEPGVGGRTRIVSALVLLAILAALSLHSDAEHPRRTISEYLAEPAIDDRGPVEIVARIESVEAPGVWWALDPSDGTRVKVHGGIPEDGAPEVSEDDADCLVTMSGSFNRRTYRPHAIHVHRGRDLKIVFSVLAVVFVGFLLVRRFRWSAVSRSIEERDRA